MMRYYIRYGVLQIPAGVFYATREDAQRIADVVPDVLGPAIVCESDQ